MPRGKGSQVPHSLQGKTPPPVSDTRPGSGTHAFERREHPRFGIPDAVPELIRDGLLQQLGFRKKNVAAAAIDLCEGGAQLRITERLRPGTRVRVHLSMSKIRDEIKAAGEVRWCFQSGQNKKHFYTGIHFRELASDQAVKISTMRKCFATANYKAVRDSDARRKGPGPLPRS